jgi:hypothetical protein
MTTIYDVGGSMTRWRPLIPFLFRDVSLNQCLYIDGSAAPRPVYQEIWRQDLPNLSPPIKEFRKVTEMVGCRGKLNAIPRLTVHLPGPPDRPRMGPIPWSGLARHLAVDKPCEPLYERPEKAMSGRADQRVLQPSLNFGLDTGMIGELLESSQPSHNPLIHYIELKIDAPWSIMVGEIVP